MKQQSEALEAVVVETNDSALEAVADSQTAFDSDEKQHRYTGASVRADTGNRSISKMSAVPRSGKAASVKTRTERKQNNAVANGALETDNKDSAETQIISRPATNSEVTAPNIPFMTSDRVASGDHCEQLPVSSSNCYAETVSDAEFIAVRRKRKVAGPKQKAHQSDDICSSWDRRPSRPMKSNIHQRTGRSSPSQIQSANQKSSNTSVVDLLDSTPSAFPALPSLRVRRNSTGDVPAMSESNDDGSDLESVKSMQTSSSRRTNWGRSQGTSSYASVVVGNTFNKETPSVNVSQSSTTIPQKSTHSGNGLDVSPSCTHVSNPSTFEEVSAAEVAAISGSLSDALDSSEFVSDSSVICEDQKVGRNNRQTQSGSLTCPRANRCGHSVLFFDTRSKVSSIPVPSLDISFGFDDSLASGAVSSSSLTLTDGSQAAPPAPQILQNKPATNVEFLQQSSVAHSSSSSRASIASLPRSSFDLRAAQKYLLSGECRVFHKGLWKTENRFGFGFNNQTVQKFAIRSDGLLAETTVRSSN